MHVYTFSEAKQNFSSLLDQAKEEGAVQIARKDGQLFMLTPITPQKSPLDIAGVALNLTTDEIVEFVREGRDRFNGL
jgi:antitoxin (DNA-binding transcriptional repressor) of toxin-antitoxin stability system